MSIPQGRDCVEGILPLNNPQKGWHSSATHEWRYPAIFLMTDPNVEAITKQSEGLLWDSRGW